MNEVRAISFLLVLVILIAGGCSKKVSPKSGEEEWRDEISQDIELALQEELQAQKERHPERALTPKEESHWIAMIYSIQNRLEAKGRHKLMPGELFKTKRRINDFARRTYQHYFSLPRHIENDLNKLVVEIDKKIIALNQPETRDYSDIIEIPIEREKLSFKLAFRWPTFKKRITCGYGERIHPITGRRSFHDAIDLGGRTGDLILATEAGRVVYIGQKRFSGKLVIIEHANGYRSYYAHLSDFLTAKGMYVEKGQPIALMGTTGRSTGPHLHFKISKNGQALDPTVVLPRM